MARLNFHVCSWIMLDCCHHIHLYSCDIYLFFDIFFFLYEDFMSWQPEITLMWKRMLSATCNGYKNLNLFAYFQALGAGFSQFAEPVFQRCISIIQSQLLAKVQSWSFDCSWIIWQDWTLLLFITTPSPLYKVSKIGLMAFLLSSHS